MNLIKWKMISRLSLPLLALSFIAAGCASKPRPVAWNLKINKSTTASIEADIIGVNPTDKPYWINGVKPDEYWKPNNSIRKGAKKVSKILEKDQPWLLAKDDPIWQEWFSYGATELIIMANLPGGGDNSPFDRRRVVIPLDKKIWQAKGGTLQIEVQDQFIRVLTPQNAHN